MGYIASWRNFRRMQISTFVAASLIYAGAVAYAWRTLPDADGLRFQRTVVFPASFLLLSWLLPLLIPAIRRRLTKYVWLSYMAGFGQSVISVLTGIGLIIAAAAFIYWQVAEVANGGRYPAGVFSGYAAGIGILLAQVLLGRRMEDNPEIRAIIED